MLIALWVSGHGDDVQGNQHHLVAFWLVLQKLGRYVQIFIAIVGFHVQA
jgi:hypothetical protein